MHRRQRAGFLAIMAAACLAAPTADADCLPADGALMKIELRVERCRAIRAPRPDRRPLIRLDGESTNTSVTPRGSADPAILAMHESSVAAIADAGRFFIEASQAVTCDDFTYGSTVRGEVVDLCCDVIPKRGLCKVTNHLLQPLPSKEKVHELAEAMLRHDLVAGYLGANAMRVPHVSFDGEDLSDATIARLARDDVVVEPGSAWKGAGMRVSIQAPSLLSDGTYEIGYGAYCGDLCGSSNVGTARLVDDQWEVIELRVVLFQ